MGIKVSGRGNDGSNPIDQQIEGAQAESLPGAVVADEYVGEGSPNVLLPSRGGALDSSLLVASSGATEDQERARYTELLVRLGERLRTESSSSLGREFSRLAEYGDRTVPFLLEHMHDESADVRYASARALERLLALPEIAYDFRSVTETLIEARINDGDMDVQFAATDALSSLRHDEERAMAIDLMMPFLFEISRDMTEEMLYEIEALFSEMTVLDHERFFENLFTALIGEDADRRERAAILIGDIPVEYVMLYEVLDRTISEQDPVIHERLITALHLILRSEHEQTGFLDYIQSRTEGTAVPLLRELLRKVSPTMVFAAKTLITQYGDTSIIANMRELAETGYIDMQTLAQMESRVVYSGEPPIRERLADPNPEVRRSAAFTLSVNGSPEDIPALDARLTDTDRIVRETAQTAIDSIMNRYSQTGGAADSEEQFPESIEDPARPAASMLETERPVAEERPVEGSPRPVVVNVAPLETSIDREEIRNIARSYGLLEHFEVRGEWPRSISQLDEVVIESVGEQEAGEQALEHIRESEGLWVVQPSIEERIGMRLALIMATREGIGSDYIEEMVRYDELLSRAIERDSERGSERFERTSENERRIMDSRSAFRRGLEAARRVR